MEIVLETKRLLLRKLNNNDFANLCTILKDPEVMYAYEHAFSDAEVIQWLNKQLIRYKNDGIGLWAVILKDNNEFIGQCGLTIQDIEDNKVVEIGYLFRKDYWNNGYAIEAASACKNYAFEILNIDKVYSIIRDNNFPSQKLAIKNGMTPGKTIIKHYYNMEMPHILYSISQQDYIKNKEG